MAYSDPDGDGRFIPIGGGRYPDGTTVNGGVPISWNGQPIRPVIPFAPAGPRRPAPMPVTSGGRWDTGSISKHPFKGLSELLESSILSRLMSQKGLEGTEVRGLDGGGVAYGHLEQPFGQLTNFWNNWIPGQAAAPAVAPPRNRGLREQLGNVFTKVLDGNGYPVEAFPGPWKKTGYNSDGSPAQYKHGQTGANIPNPYL